MDESSTNGINLKSGNNTNIIYAGSRDLKSSSVYVKCTCDNIKYILCVAAYSNDTTGDNISTVKKFSTSFDNIFNSTQELSEDQDKGPYSYCINSSGELVNVNNRTFEFGADNDKTTIKFIFDDNGNFKIGVYDENGNNNGNDNLVKYLYVNDENSNTFGISFLYGKSKNEGCVHATIPDSGKNIFRRARNYRDPLLLTSDDDFFLLHNEEDNNDKKIGFINIDTLEYNIFNKYLNQFDNNTHSLPRINENFFEDKTLANRNYSIPSIIEELGKDGENATYYKYLKYIKTHSCKELFYRGYDTDIGIDNNFGQAINNNLDKSIYMNSDGSEKTIYEFYRTILKYYVNGNIKD